MRTPIAYFLLLSAILFALGTTTVLVRRSALRIFMGVELQLNAVNLTLVAFSRMHMELDGQVLAFFSMVVAAAEVVVGLAIIVAVFRRTGSIDVDEADVLRGMIDAIALVIAVPLLAAVINGFFGRRLGRWSGWLATLAMAAAFVVAAGALLQMLSLPVDERTQVITVADWITAGATSVSLNLRVDPLSITMVMVVTLVGSLIHLYAIGYMEHDPRPWRFFAYTNLFCAFMLTLVLANDFLLLYLGWEGVGLCSYLLIGFWSDRPEAARAAKKAFITTRVGDVLLMLGLFVMFVHFGSFSFDVVLGSEGALPVIAASTATAISLLLLGGAVGKSAQLPLHVWLPDAMAGPTPVSALIHAATMVTAGVYLVVRSHVLFEISDVALDVVAVVGLAGALYGGLASIGQYDMKRALAYSTMSQLGFMFLAAGLGLFPLAITLLVAHAFYKALLFLSAGNVMHGLHDEIDVRRLGGLKRDMPWTAGLFLAGALSLSGLPPFSGFFTKDTIVELASHDGDVIIFVLGSIAAMLSAWYIMRPFFQAFIGKPRYEGEAHEASWLMRAPLLVLAAGGLFIGLSLAFTPEGRLATFLEPVLGPVVEGDAGPSTQVLIAIAIALTLVGIAIAWSLYGPSKTERWISFPEREPGMAGALGHGFYIDDLYAWVVSNVGLRGAAFLSWFDRTVIDGAVNGVGDLGRLASGLAPVWQSGRFRRYALSFLAGGVALLLYAVVRV